METIRANRPLFDEYNFKRKNEYYKYRHVGEHLLQCLTGETGIYKSSFFSNSAFKDGGIISGSKLKKDKNAKTIVSLKDFVENSFALFGLTYNIEKIDGKEIFRHEKLSYFFREKVVLTLKNVNVLARRPSLDVSFNSIDVGYAHFESSKEETTTEYNAKSTFNTPLSNGTKLNLVSPWRADFQGKNKRIDSVVEDEVKETESDTSIDLNIFNLDCIYYQDNFFRERFWTDDFEEEPKGVDFPNHATSLRLTPSRMLKNHLPLIKSGLNSFEEEYVNYICSVGNAKVSTKKTNEKELKENQSFLIKDIANSIFLNELIEFEAPLEDVIELINSYKEEDGEKIPLMYYKIAIDFEGSIELGYLFDFKIFEEKVVMQILKTN